MQNVYRDIFNVICCIVLLIFVNRRIFVNIKVHYVVSRWQLSFLFDYVMFCMMIYLFMYAALPFTCCTIQHVEYCILKLMMNWMNVWIIYIRIMVVHWWIVWCWTYRVIHCVQKENTHSRFLLYLRVVHGKWLDIYKTFRVCLRGMKYSADIKIKYSLLLDLILTSCLWIIRFTEPR